MFGKSDQEKAYESIYRSLAGQNFKADNYFKDWRPVYDKGQMMANLNSLFSNYRKMIQDSANQNLAKASQDALSSLASRGILGGSILDNTRNSIANTINKEKLMQLNNLSANESQQLANLMSYLNNLDYQKTLAAQNVDFQNIDALAKKYGLQLNAARYLDDDTALDNLLAIINTGGTFAGNIAPYFIGKT